MAAPLHDILLASRLTKESDEDEATAATDEEPSSDIKFCRRSSVLIVEFLDKCVARCSMPLRTSSRHDPHIFKKSA